MNFNHTLRQIRTTQCSVSLSWSSPTLPSRTAWGDATVPSCTNWGSASLPTWTATLPLRTVCCNCSTLSPTVVIQVHQVRSVLVPRIQLTAVNDIHYACCIYVDCTCISSHSVRTSQILWNNNRCFYIPVQTGSKHFHFLKKFIVLITNFFFFNTDPVMWQLCISIERQ